MSAPPRVFVTRTLPGDAPLARLRAAVDADVWELERPPTPEELAGRAAGCAGLLTMLTERVDAALLDRRGVDLADAGHRSRAQPGRGGGAECRG